jgi:hypothetical protein
MSIPGFQKLTHGIKSDSRGKELLNVPTHLEQ